MSTRKERDEMMKYFLETIGVNEPSRTKFIKVDGAIKLKNVIKTYGKGEAEIKALRGVDLTIRNGEIVTVMGPSGSGKTTLLNLLGAMDFVTDGQVIVDGWDITKLPETKLSEFRKYSVGFIFQDFYLIPGLNVLENVLSPIIPYGVTNEIRERAKELLKMVGLGDRFNQKVEKLSGGQKQRVAIARSLINNPNIILADEPTGNLDSEIGKGILDLLIGLAEKGKTIVIVTHDPRISQLVKSHPRGRNIWMQDGKLSDKPTIDFECWG